MAAGTTCGGRREKQRRNVVNGEEEDEEVWGWVVRGVWGRKTRWWRDVEEV